MTCVTFLFFLGLSVKKQGENWFDRESCWWLLCITHICGIYIVLHRSGVFIVPLCFSLLWYPEQNIVVEIKLSLLKYFIGIFQLLTRALLLKQRSRLLFITDDIYNWAYAHRARKRESTVCSRLVPKNCCYLLVLFDLVMVHYHPSLLFGKQKSENNKTALFNSEKPWISIEFTSSNLILKVVWQNPGEEMIIAVSDRTPASTTLRLLLLPSC